MTSFLIIVLLLAINGFFVAAEFALVKMRGVRNAQVAAGGSRVIHVFRLSIVGKKVHMAIIVDEYGQFCGIVTLEDMLVHVSGIHTGLRIT